MTYILAVHHERMSSLIIFIFTKDSLAQGQILYVSEGERLVKEECIAPIFWVEEGLPWKSDMKSRSRHNFLNQQVSLSYEVILLSSGCHCGTDKFRHPEKSYNHSRIRHGKNFEEELAGRIYLGKDFSICGYRQDCFWIWRDLTQVGHHRSGNEESSCDFHENFRFPRWPHGSATTFWWH